MTSAIPQMFADVTAKLEDLHAIAVEGQRADNAPDMQSMFSAHLRVGLVAVEGTMRAIAVALGESRR